MLRPFFSFYVLKNMSTMCATTKENDVKRLYIHLTVDGMGQCVETSGDTGVRQVATGCCDAQGGSCCVCRVSKGYVQAADRAACCCCTSDSEMKCSGAECC